METISYTALRNDLAATLDRVNRDHAPIMITRQNGEPAVLMSMEDFKSYEATAYLDGESENAARLNDAVEQIESGKSKKRDLIEE